MISGGLRAESWLDRLICGVWHRGRHSWSFDPDGTKRRSCLVSGCGMLVVHRPLRARLQAKARQEATAVLQGKGARW